MNKAVLKYEMKNIRGIFILSIFASLALISITNMAFKSQFQLMLMSGIAPNESMVMDNIQEIGIIAMLGFSALALIQVFMQFRQEKGQEVARFLKSLPIKSEEYFVTKLLVGILSLTVAFLVFIIGVLLVRQMNMFWISDYHNFSLDPNLFKSMDGVYNTIKIMLLSYTIVLVFYSFIFMIQYKISNIFVSIVSSVFIWFAPYFIAGVMGLWLNEIGITSIFKELMLSADGIRWLNPFVYMIDYKHISLLSHGSSSYVNNIGFIANINLKFIVLSLMLVVNIAMAYRAAKKNLIENEDKMIPVKTDRYIFIVGVTVCSGLLAYFLLAEMFGLRFAEIIIAVLPIVGSIAGFFVSKKVAFIGCK